MSEGGGLGGCKVQVLICIISLTKSFFNKEFYFMSLNWIYNFSVFSTDKKHHFESLNNNEMVDSEVLVTKKS